MLKFMFDFHILERWAKEKPNEIAFIDNQVQINYAQLSSFVLRTAEFLKGAGIERGMIVNIHLPSFLNWTTTLALHILGITSISRKNVINSDPWLIHDFHLSLDQDSAVPSERNIIFNETLVEQIKQTAEYQGDFGFHAPTDIARLIPTSGTTGDTKFISVLAGDLTELANLKNAWDFVGDGRLLGLFPMGARQSYRFAFNILANGQTLYRSDFLDYRLAKLLRRNPIHTVYGSPTQILKLLDSIKHTGSALPDLKYVAMSGSSPNQNFVSRIRQELQCEIVNVYGSTEVGNAATSKLIGTEVTGFTLNNQIELQIVNDQHQVLPAESSGLIRYRNSTMAREYYQNPKATQEFFRDGYFYPGDVGYLDSEGKLYLEGRAQDVLNLGGVKYNPDKLDQIVQSQLGVVDCAVFAMHDEDGSEQIGLALVVDEDFDLETFSKVMAKKFPVKVDHLFKMGALPRNENGKINRHQLAERHRKHP